jgi:acetoin utilization deacetylase AcuC-like enzyme
MMITIYSPDHRRQNAQAELNDGKLMPPFDNPQRAETILDRISQIKLGQIISPRDFGIEPILRVHDRRYLSFLETAWNEWILAHGNCDALPLVWAVRTMRSDRVPEHIDGKLSYYSFDAGTPITSGTWQAATASANVALTAQEMLTKGERAVFALCRPPGHHAAIDLYGGYCFLNNAAIVAQAALDNGCDRVCILDVDYHHGNGTQSIFYDRNDVLFVSLHADPTHEYPFFLGYADEKGIGKGLGFNHNYPMPWGTNWHVYRETLIDAIGYINNYSPDLTIVSLGLDTFEKDPLAKFSFKTEDYLRLGETIALINKPTLFVMEGGYAIEYLGENVTNVLVGFEGLRD